ncbi:hypothetical protein, partial [Silicimonas algicola]|uniref:hypothetical protein n=1 Tax=Silicimonas algicola TaxID=1826607 RepID=UPI001B86006A
REKRGSQCQKFHFHPPRVFAGQRRSYRRMSLFICSDPVSLQTAINLVQVCVQLDVHLLSAFADHVVQFVTRTC